MLIITKISATILAVLLAVAPAQKMKQFPDGTRAERWFKAGQSRTPKAERTQYIITEHGVRQDSTILQTAQIQAVIDKAAAAGGGTVVIPAGTYLSGSLFFKPGTHLHLQKGATLKGSDDISDFALLETRIEGQTCKYFAAIVNADGCNGFHLTGEGTLDGNGLRYWKAFWLRRKFNPDCTNKDEMRPRLLYVSNSDDVLVEGVRLRNSPFWTTHFYKCKWLRLKDLHITSPRRPVAAPSTDAVDLDACRYVHISGCYMSVNDDAIALKGGKGPYADTAPENGPNEFVLIENCRFGFCHSALTAGSECVTARNIVMRNCTVDGPWVLLRLKMRPDTPQVYEHFLLDGISGNCGSVLHIHPWTQFYDLGDRRDIPLSIGRHITIQNCSLESKTVRDIEEMPEQYLLEDLKILED